MRLEGHSTLAMSVLMRTSTLSTRARLEVAQLELSSGRHADMGLALGQSTASAITLRREIAELGFLADRINLARVKAETTQSVLNSIISLADSFMSTLAGARTSDQGPALARTAASGLLSSMQDLLNTTFDGQYLFGGLNGATAPMQQYQGSDGKTAFDQAFLASFGFAQGDPQTSGITSLQIEAFVAGPLEALFEPVAWSALWSSATQETPSVRLGSDLTVSASSTASAPAIATLTRALVMVTELAQDGLGQAAYQGIVDASLSLVAGAKAQIGLEQARIGQAQSELARALERYDRREVSLAISVGTLESVDPYEAATRVNTLMSQLEISYTITGRLQQLNLMNYI